MLSWLSGQWGSTPATPSKKVSVEKESFNALSEIPSGMLYKKSSHLSLDGASSQLVFKDSTMSIRKTSSKFHYQLVITRVFEEGEDELEESDDADSIDSFVDADNRYERVVLLHPDTYFRRIKKTDSTWIFTWYDSDDIEYEWIPDAGISFEIVERFAWSATKCMYEMKHKIDTFGVPSESLSKFEAELEEAAYRRKNADLYCATPKKGLYPKLSPEQETMVTPIKAQSKQASSPPPAEELASFVPEGESLLVSSGTLALFDFELQSFNAAYDLAKVDIIQAKTFEFWIVLRDKFDVPIMCQPIEPDMSPILRQTDRTFAWVWCDQDSKKPLYGWQLNFEDDEAFTLFKTKFSACMYEALHKDRFEKMKEEDQRYVEEAFMDDVEMLDAEEEEEEEEEEEPVSTIRDSASRAAFDEDSADEDDDAYGKAQLEEDRHAKNSSLVVGLQNDRSFVVRGNKIGVFKHTNEDGLKFTAAINNIRSLKEAPFSPRKLMLHQQDSSLLMTNGQDDRTIYKMDLERGKVVEEWKVDDILPVEDFIPDQKYAQRTQNQTFIGINHNSIFRIDPRLAGNKRVESQSKQYATKAKFSCAATTGAGDLVVASAKGDMRLFNKLNTRAKTMLPGLGDPIIGIDTTENGKWIVGTCKNYLLLINTEIKDEQPGTLGFQKPMGQNSRPVPRRLQLKPEHVAWMGTPVSFTPARFNTGEGCEEKTIVTSTGPYVITWNFRRVKQGRLYDYQIKKYTDTVVADNFKYNEDRSIIVALPTNVEMINRSNLCTPTKLLKSRSDIVNSPY